MLILGLDTSSSRGGVALIDDGGILSNYSYRLVKSHSQELLPSINLLLRNSHISLHDIGCIAVASGPGSFTGLRIGISTAKAVALALQIPVYGIPTLDAMVYPLPILEYNICPIIDAKKKEVYAAIFASKGGRREKIISDRVISPKDLCRFITSPTVFLGNGLEIYRETIELTLGSLAIPWMNIDGLTALGVAWLGFNLFEKGHVSEFISLKPVYLRRSDAEIKWEEKFK